MVVSNRIEPVERHLLRVCRRVLQQWADLRIAGGNTVRRPCGERVLIGL